MTLPRLHWINGTIYERIYFGGWSTLGAEVYRRRSAYDTGILQADAYANNDFISKRGIQSVVGGNYPLGTYMGMGDVSSQERQLALRIRYKKWLNGMAQEWVQSMPLNGLTFVVDSGPIVVSKEIGEPIVNFLKRRRDGFVGADRATMEAFSLPTALVAPITYQVTTRELLEEIQRHMLEPIIDGGVTWSVWTFAQVINYLNERLSRFELETGLIKSVVAIPVISGDSTIDLPSNLVDLYRLTWEDSVTAPSALLVVDEHAMDNGSPGWQVAANSTPWAYIEDPMDPLTIQLVPTPNLDGTLKVYMAYDIGIMAGSVGEILPLPNCFTPYIKYGVMADMLSAEGEPRDPERASYCENRYKEGVQIARMLLGAPVQQLTVGGKEPNGPTGK